MFVSPFEPLGAAEEEEAWDSKGSGSAKVQGREQVVGREELAPHLRGPRQNGMGLEMQGRKGEGGIILQWFLWRLLKAVGHILPSTRVPF